MSNILAKIVEDKKVEVAKRKIDKPLDTFIDQVTPNENSFYDALKHADVGYILECKKASPSKGLIRPDFNLNAICDVYSQYASCISVLTDEKYFQGSFDYLKQVTGMVKQPVICKDFFIDAYQIYLARLNGASAILLMLSVLDDSEYSELATLAGELNLSILTEVSNEEEMARALALNANIIGINNRNLRDLSTDTARTFELVKHIPSERRDEIVVISESGIYHHQQVQKLSTVADGFLVGSSLMGQDDINKACRQMIYGEHKICGMSKSEDAIAAFNGGATFGGLIFYPPSPRSVDVDCAMHIIEAAPLNYVGVFVNEKVAKVADIAGRLKLAAVQLHGDEDQAYINELKPLLNANSSTKGCEIFKALPVKDKLPTFELNVDRYVLDTYHQDLKGGSGQTFNWQLLDELPTDGKFMLAGGLNVDNIPTAAKQVAIGLDINSGVESAKGVKDPNKITQALALITGAL